MEFVVHMNPIGKARPRFARGGRAYTDRKTHRAEDFIRKAFLQAGGQKLERGVPVAVYVHLVYAIPKSYPKKRIQECEDGLELPTKKPDADNALKLVLDALNGAAYADDCQVVDTSVHKRYAKDRNANGCIIVRVEESKV